MSRRSPLVIDLSVADRCELQQRTRCYSLAHSQVTRARIVLLAADGWANVDIAEELGVHVDVVSRWRKRFCVEGMAGLDDRPRSGRPRSFGSEVVAGVKAMACEAPAARDVPLSRWSSTELAAQAVTEGMVESVSASTVRRWLAADAIKPWQYRSWIFPRDPDFAAKAARVLDLYAPRVGGQEAGPERLRDQRGRKEPATSAVALSSEPGRSPGGGRRGWSSNTSGRAPSPTSAPTTSTTPG